MTNPKPLSVRLMGLTLALLLTLCLPSLAMAKTVSAPIDAPDGETVVFTVKVGEIVFEYSWDDITGESGLFAPQTRPFGDKVNGEAAVTEWTGVALCDILADVQARLGGVFAEETVVSALSADQYEASFPLAEAMDPAQNYLVAPDAVSNNDGDTQFPDSFVRILRGDEFTMSNVANIRCIVGIEVLPAEGDALPIVEQD